MLTEGGCFGGKGGWGLVVVDTVSSFKGGAISPNLGGGSNCIPKSGGSITNLEGAHYIPKSDGVFWQFMDSDSKKCENH